MAIRPLLSREFDAFNAVRMRLACHTDQAVEWFANDTGTVPGAIAYHHLDLDWSLVVLRRNGDGTFGGFDCVAGLFVPDDARRLLIDKMETAGATGEHVAASPSGA